MSDELKNAIIHLVEKVNLAVRTHKPDEAMVWAQAAHQLAHVAEAMSRIRAREYEPP